MVDGATDAVVAVVWAFDTMGSYWRDGTWRYDSGRRTALANFNAKECIFVEGWPGTGQVFMAPPLVRGAGTPDAPILSSVYAVGKQLFYRDGRLYDDLGRVYAPDTLALIGTYPIFGPYDQTGLAEVDPATRRVFYLEGYFNYGRTFYKLKVFDRDLYHALFSLDLPRASASLTRCVRCGTNGLAYVSGDNHLWLVRTDLLAPTRSPADLNLSMASTSVPLVGSNYTYTLSLSNAGPGFATVVSVTNNLPAGVTIVKTAPSAGHLLHDASAFTWKLGALAAGSNATLEVTVRFDNAGWQTNRAYALGLDADPVFTNNFAQLVLNVEIPAGAGGVFRLLQSAEDMVYDPVRNRLLLAIASAAVGPSNGIGVLNPISGLLESFVPLGHRPFKLARSREGQFLYVSSKEDGLVQRFDLATLAQDLEFYPGGDWVNDSLSPYYAAELEPMPDNPRSLVAWRVRRPGVSMEYGYGLAVFDDGVMRSNVTAFGGAWKIGFDSAASTLYAYDTGGGFNRCALDSGGVSFAEVLPKLSFNISPSFKCAAGRLFLSSGRAVELSPFRVAGIYSGSEGARLVEPDPSTGRVFYLSRTNGWWLKAYDMNSFEPLGSLAISNLVGTPTTLVHCGSHGLAFLTASNEIFIVRTPLATDSLADLSLSIQSPADPVTVRTETAFTLNLTNAGPGSARMLVLNTKLPSNLALLTAAAPSGLLEVISNRFTWTLPLLPVGQTAQLTFTVRSLETGVVVVTSSLAAETPDPTPGNNVALPRCGREPSRGPTVWFHSRCQWVTWSGLRCSGSSY